MSIRNTFFCHFRRKVILSISLLFTMWLIALAGQIYLYSAISNSVSTDAAIVLGAAVWNEKPSPIFEERIKHGIHLYQSGRVKYLVFTGGIGKDDFKAESEIARLYAINEGVPSSQLLTERVSHITYENLYEACQVMKAANLQNALIVSDPLHMKRAMKIAEDIGIKAYPSPTPTTRYRSWRTKSGALVYEMFFYVVHMVNKMIGHVNKCSA